MLIFIKDSFADFNISILNLKGKTGVKLLWKKMGATQYYFCTRVIYKTLTQDNKH